MKDQADAHSLLRPREAPEGDPLVVSGLRDAIQLLDYGDALRGLDDSAEELKLQQG